MMREEMAVTHILMGVIRMAVSMKHAEVAVTHVS